MAVQTTIAVPAQRRHRPLALWVIATAGLTIAAATLIFAGRTARAASSPRDPSVPVAVAAWPPLATAGAFFLADVRDKIDGRWGASWLNLYPPHQQLVSQSDFVRCETATPFLAPLRSIRVLSVRRAPVDVPGLTLPVPGVALGVRLEIAAGYGPRDPVVLRHTFHLVPVDGRWTWILSPSRYKLYRDHACTSLPSP